MFLLDKQLKHIFITVLAYLFLRLLHYRTLIYIGWCLYFT